MEANQGAPRITVIIPCHNPRREVLGETLRSVEQSTIQDYRLILVNDGSTAPEALALLREAACADGRISIVQHQANRGLSAARNTGVTACKTPYFLQLDADDIIEPTFIEKCLWALETHPEWSFCNSWSVGFGAKEYLWPRGFDLRRDFLAENQVTPTAVIRRAADRTIGGHDESIRAGLEDWDYWLKMAAHGFWGGTIPEYLTLYRHHAHATFWANRDDPARRAAFRHEMRRRYPQLWTRHGFPAAIAPARAVQAELPFENRLPAPHKGLRLLLILPWFSLGGADRFNLTLVRQMAERGHQVEVCATMPGPHPWLDDFASLTPRYFVLPNFLEPEDYPRFLRYLINSRRMDVVLVSHAMLGYALLPYLRTYCPNTAFVDYNHMATDWLQGGYARVGVHAQPSLDLNIVSSHQVKQWMIARGADAGRVEVCYTNVDTAVWDPARYDRQAARAAWQIPEGRVGILFPARLEPQKRPGLLLEILRGLQRVSPDFVCLIAGDGPQRRWLAAQIRRRRLQTHARLLGAVPSHRMPELMAACDLLLLPSREEGIALALFEAMAMQVVPVVADVGGQRELVTPETGFLIPHGPGEVEAYLATLASLITSPALRATMGQAARRRIVAGFAVEQMGDCMLTLFERARSLIRSAPREALGEPEAKQLAVQVIEDLRLERLQERLRTNRPLAFSGRETGLIGVWRQIIFHAKMRLFRPVYYWMLRNGHEWVVPVANRAYRLLQGLLK